MSTNNTIEQLTEGVLIHGPDVLSHCVSHDPSVLAYLSRVRDEFLDYPAPSAEFTQPVWFMPKSYHNVDIESFLLAHSPVANHPRVLQELALFKQHNMMPVLNMMKYVVDTLRANHVVWGVGRGSSVASYVLHIIGVHKIDSIKYNIPIQEFFKGDQNG